MRASGKRGWRHATSVTAMTAAVGGLALFGVTGSAQASSSSNTGKSVVSAPYRHGVIPMVGRDYAITKCTSSECMVYHGGIDNVAVTTGHEKVYLVFWGTQWGTESTNSKGYDVFSGDPDGVAPDLQAFFDGLGTGGEKWSGIATQYCQAKTLKVGVNSCPSTAKHVAYPTGGALAGVWEDTTAASPAASTEHQLAVEAENGATHFGNTTQASNRDAQYVVISPTGTDPDHYQQDGFCAWHDYSGDASLGGGPAPGPLIAFTNMPYVPDVGYECGAGFVNPGNNLDGVTIVDGHEYNETITDQFPAGGWLDSGGAEVGDVCAWLTTGPGKVQNISLTTGTFAVQGIWSNDTNYGSCAIKHKTMT